MNPTPFIFLRKAHSHEAHPDLTRLHHYSERRTGHVERSFNLKGINQESINASFKNGLLSVELPKAEPLPESNVRKISINQTEKLEKGKE